MFKRIITLAAVTLIALGMTASPDIKDILNGLKNGGKTENTGNGSDEKGGSSTNPLDALAGLGNALGLIPSKTVDADYLKGMWSYQKPAVAFKSDNFLAKAGGVAASAKIESELEPYYNRVGLDKVKLTVNADSTFTMNLSRGNLSGKISTVGEKDKQRLMFSFALMGKIPVGSMEAFVNAETSSVMSLTFDVTKLMNILQKVAGLSNSTSLKTLSKLMEQYEGMTAGFKMKKTAESAK